MRVVQANLAKLVGLPADADESTIDRVLADTFVHDRDRVLAELGSTPAETRPEPMQPLHDLRILGF